MSEHATPKTKPADDPAFQLPASLGALSIPLTVVGLVMLAAGWGLANNISDRFGMSAYLTAFVYCVSLAVGCLFFVMLQHLVRAGWSVVVRRIAETVMLMVIPLAVLFLPIIGTLLFGEGVLYRWDNPNHAIDNHLPMAAWTEKTRWLDSSWFTIRAVIYFAIWSALALFYYRGSINQDATGDKAITDKLQYWSGPAIMMFCGATSFAAFDWVMSLAPMWFSTMFGVYIFAGSILSAHCIISVAVYTLQKRGAIQEEVTVEHYHDLGKYMFGFVFFWTYIAFSQFLLIWYGNIPEETHWFYERQVGEWGTIALVLIFFHWMLPFAGLMSRHIRRNPKLVFAWAIYLLVVHFIDIYWIIMPESAADGTAHASTEGAIGISASLLCVVGMFLFMIGMVLRIAKQNAVIAVHDPRLQESIAFENI
ncbi:hypothetical protein N9D38_07525 [Rubripirellula sp.]|jgi:hypothetical protein|nr:hypothetical protein [Rubripirellula sp.]